jgi:hypothetical protein
LLLKFTFTIYTKKMKKTQVLCVLNFNGHENIVFFKVKMKIFLKLDLLECSSVWRDLLLTTLQSWLLSPSKVGRNVFPKIIKLVHETAAVLLFTVLTTCDLIYLLIFQQNMKSLTMTVYLQHLQRSQCST